MAGLLAGLAAGLVAQSAAAQCAPFDPGTAPGAPEAAPVTSPRYYYLSQIGGCANLECWVEHVANTAYSTATLVVDESCTLEGTLTLPDRFVLAGVGMDAGGELYFPNIGNGQPAIEIDSGADGVAAVTIRDLTIHGSPSQRGYGIALVQDSQVTIERVRLYHFSTGILGDSSLSVVIDKSNISDNLYNVRLGMICNAWRITNSILNGATRYAIYEQYSSTLGALLNSSVYAQNRIESNDAGGIFVSGWGPSCATTSSS